MKYIFLFLLAITANLAFSQSFLGRVSKQVNFRQGPGKEFDVISSLPQGTALFIISLETTNDFYNVIDIKNDKEGYVHKSFINIGEEIEKNESGLFTPSGTTSEYNPSIEIYNNTDLNLTLKLNEKTFSFYAQEKKTITMPPGSCSYRASAPGVMSNYGTEYMKSNQDYTWQFYIVTERR